MKKTSYSLPNKFIYIALIFLYISSSVSAMKPDTLFQSDDILTLQIRTNFSKILAGRTELPVKYEGVLIIRNPNGSENRLSIKISSRGNFRRDPENCSFPPLRIDFRKKETEKSLFSGQDKMKLVTPCQHDKDVLEEYIVYKMYNKVTDRSLKVRLAKIEYFDTGKSKSLFERYSFFIEDVDHAAGRLGAVETIKFMTPYDLDTEEFSKLAVFQFMIGNKDWYVTSQKNIILMQPQDSTSPPFAVPYDFDFAGYVNADYTRPGNVPIERLTPRRVFKGICTDEEITYRVLQFYGELRPELEKINNDFKFLPRTNRELGRKYLDEFFSMISDAGMVRKNLLESCESRSLYNLSSARSEP